MIKRPTPGSKSDEKKLTMREQVALLPVRDRMIRLLVLLLVGLTCYGFFVKILFF